LFKYEDFEGCNSGHSPAAAVEFTFKLKKDDKDDWDDTLLKRALEVTTYLGTGLNANVSVKKN